MTPVLLASRSASRAAILKGAGVAFETAVSGVDETAAKERLLAAGADPKAIAARPEALVIGADQTLDLAGRLYDKAESLAEARERLLELRGQTHLLHSAVVVARAGASVWRVIESPRLTMRAFSDAYLDSYLDRLGETLLGSVGCYQLEGEGAQLFERIEGDYFAILGLPLAPLLGCLRDAGVLPT